MIQNLPYDILLRVFRFIPIQKLPYGVIVDPALNVHVAEQLLGLQIPHLSDQLATMDALKVIFCKKTTWRTVNKHILLKLCVDSKAFLLFKVLLNYTTRSFRLKSHLLWAAAGHGNSHYDMLQFLVHTHHVQLGSDEFARHLINATRLRFSVYRHSAVQLYNAGFRVHYGEMFLGQDFPTLQIYLNNMQLPMGTDVTLHVAAFGGHAELFFHILRIKALEPYEVLAHECALPSSNMNGFNHLLRHMNPIPQGVDYSIFLRHVFHEDGENPYAWTLETYSAFLHVILPRLTVAGHLEVFKFHCVYQFGRRMYLQAMRPYMTTIFRTTMDPLLCNLVHLAMSAGAIDVVSSLCNDHGAVIAASTLELDMVQHLWAQDPIPHSVLGLLASTGILVRISSPTLMDRLFTWLNSNKYEEVRTIFKYTSCRNYVLKYLESWQAGPNNTVFPMFDINIYKKIIHCMATSSPEVPVVGDAYLFMA